MYATIRHYKTNPGVATEIAQKVNEGFVPIISQAQGFVAYYALDTGNDTVASISVFQDQAGSDESTRLAADWVKNNIASLFAGPPEVTDGEVLAYKIK